MHYDSDSDFDYRTHQRPPRPRGRRGQRRRSSSSSSSTTSSSSSSSDVDFSPLPRVRSIEAALDRERGTTIATVAPPTRYLQAASLQRQRSASVRGQSWKDQWRTMGGRTKLSQFRQLQIQDPNKQQETNFM